MRKDENSHRTCPSLDTSDNACSLAFYSLITLHNVHYQYLISDLENLLNFAQLPNAFTLKTGCNCSNLHCRN